MKKLIPEKTIKRLTLYHFILNECELNGLEYISSPRIANLLNIDDSQVRKDIKYISNVGKCKVGYEIKELKKNVEIALGFAKPKNAFIVGAGNLGCALISYDDFINYGLNILALFDIDKNKINKQINSKKIYHINELPNMIKTLGADIAILTVPKEVAQDVAVFLVECGIKYIWNFTPRVLSVNKNIRVWNENLIGNFLQFISEDEL